MDLQEKMFSKTNAWRESGLTKLGKVLEIEAPSGENNRLCKSMFEFDEASKIFIYAKPTNMRKGFDGLYSLITNHMDLDAL